MTDISTKTNLLIEELHNYFIFYIPKSSFMNFLKEYKIDYDKLSQLDPFINKVTYIENQNFYLFKKSPFEISELTFKINNLCKNTFHLFDLKENLQPDTFKFILKKYQDQLIFHFTAATLLVDNYEEFCNEKSNDLKNILELQLTIIKNHSNEIKTHFESLQQIETNFNLLQLPDLNSMKSEIIKPDSEIYSYLLKKKPKKKKLNKEDAIAFLLKTVFSKKTS